jgi:hypothetical protein
MNALVHLAGPLEGSDLGLHDREAAKFVAGARHHPALKRPRVRRVSLEERLRQKVV